MTMYQAGVLERTKVSDADSKVFAHIADSAKIVESYVTGIPVEALCGKVFLPTRNPDGLQVCPECKEIADALYISYSL